MVNELKLDDIYVICNGCYNKYSLNQLNHINNALECPECGDVSVDHFSICTPTYNEVIR